MAGLGAARFKKWGSRPQRSCPMHLKRHVPVLSGKERRATGKRNGPLTALIADFDSLYSIS